MKKYEPKVVAADNFTLPENFETLKSIDSNIAFTATDVEGVCFPHYDPLLVMLRVADCNISRILIDTRDPLDLIFKNTLDKMALPDLIFIEFSFVEWCSGNQPGKAEPYENR